MEGKVADWREVKIKDIGMQRRYYNKIVGKLARLIYYDAKSKGLHEVCERISGVDGKNWEYGNVTLGDIERIGFDEFISIQGVGPATFRDFLARASDIGMKISLDKSSSLTEKFDSAKEIGMLGDYKCFDVVRKSRIPQTKPISDKEKFEKLTEYLKADGISTLIDLPAEYFEKNSRKFKKIKKQVIAYFQTLKDKVMATESIEDFDAIEKYVDDQMYQFGQIVERKRMEGMTLEERKPAYGGKVDVNIRHIDKKYYRTAFKPKHEADVHDLGD